LVSAICGTSPGTVEDRNRIDGRRVVDGRLAAEGPTQDRVTAVQAILKSLGWRFCSMAKLVFGMNQSLDGYVDHQEFAPDAAFFRHFIEQVRGLTGSVYGRRLY
jgi:hypothetical protein